MQQTSENDAARWEDALDPAEMLALCAGHIPEQEQFLFGCACARRFLADMNDARVTRSVEILEGIALGERVKGMATARKTLATAQSAYWDQLGKGEVLRAISLLLGRSDISPFRVAERLAQARGLLDCLSAGKMAWQVEATASLEEQAKQAGVLRDIVRNPFVRMDLNRPWLATVPRVKAVALGIRQGRAFEDLPILGDVREDADCPVPEMMNHCRNEQNHVAGCWVIELICGSGI